MVISSSFFLLFKQKLRSGIVAHSLIKVTRDLLNNLFSGDLLPFSGQIFTILGLQEREF